ncbi:MAG: LPS export ABC transporter periplasmic protein LptC [Bacteroidetes bacterium]|nr:LPS export ABC transporter periplasmic protein LptC [Bacteroidota bacterium]
MKSIKQKIKQIILALLFGSALFVVGCKETKVKAEKPLIRRTMESDNLTITQYSDGTMDYKFITPHVTRYEGKGSQSQDTSFMIFDKGVNVVTFEDSTTNEESRIIAKYAVYQESEQLWEARDSVVGLSKDGKEIYTDLLYWNQKTKKIYSPIYTKVVSGNEIIIGVNGFESDDKMENIKFTKSQGRFLVDTLSTKE